MQEKHPIAALPAQHLTEDQPHVHEPAKKGETPTEVDPPYEKTTKAGGYRFEVDIERFRQSDTWALAGPQLRPWITMIWLESWTQLPAGSLPDSEEIIAARIEMPLDEFRASKSVLLRGWYRASDGRLYHTVITEQILGLIKRKTDWAARQRSHRRRQKENLEGSVTRDSEQTHQEPQESHEPTTTTTTTTNKEKNQKRTARGARLSPNWKPSEPDRAFAIEHAVDPDNETAVFVDYWISQAGSKAIKADWSATWRNWIRKNTNRGPASLSARSARTTTHNTGFEKLDYRRDEEAWNCR